MVQVKYTQKDIYERVFKQKRMGVGYDPQDVDDFLDDIINDYGIFNERIEELQTEVGRLQTALKQAQAELANRGQSGKAPAQPKEEAIVATKANSQPTSAASEQPAHQAAHQEPESAAAAPVKEATNLDLIKRVANLERAVFGHERS
ncbi:DivIVA domain-containing protein [Leuconostocaceae bacterium ESL0723]|nr:DivIVA domain-containing protein [Leuconostocaceae bacterium ESL0723]